MARQKAVSGTKTKEKATAKPLSKPTIIPVSNKAEPQVMDWDDGTGGRWYNIPIEDLVIFSVPTMAEHEKNEKKLVPVCAPDSEIERLFNMAMKEYELDPDYTLEYDPLHITGKNDYTVLWGQHWIKVAEKWNRKFINNDEIQITHLKCIPVAKRLKDDDEKEKYALMGLFNQITIPPKMKMQIAERIMEIAEKYAALRRQATQKQNVKTGTKVPLGKKGRATDDLKRMKIGRNNWDLYKKIKAEFPQIIAEWGDDESFKVIENRYKMSKGILEPAGDNVMKYILDASTLSDKLLDIVMLMDIDKFFKVAGREDNKEKAALITLLRNFEPLSKRIAARCSDLVAVTGLEI